MSIDRSISGGTGQVLVLSVRDVEVGFGISVLLGQTEVDDVYLISTLSNAHQEVVGLDITMDERLRVNILDTRDLCRLIISGVCRSEYLRCDTTYQLVGEQ
jgi:hypothetical protein